MGSGTSPVPHSARTKFCFGRSVVLLLCDRFNGYDIIVPTTNDGAIYLYLLQTIRAPQEDMQIFLSYSSTVRSWHLCLSSSTLFSIVPIVVDQGSRFPLSCPQLCHKIRNKVIFTALLASENFWFRICFNMSSFITRALFRIQDSATLMLFGKEKVSTASHFYDLTDRNMNGSETRMDEFLGSVLCVVNVASQWGLTDANYSQLVKLHDEYQSQGLQILAFPCNQFGGQEPVSDEGLWRNWLEFAQSVLC